jgi:hypothetical protein
VSAGKGWPTLKHLGIVAVASTSDTIGSPILEILALDPDTAALIAEVDPISCAALTATRRQLAPPVTGRAFVRTGPLVGPAVDWSALGRGPVQPVHPVQRSPPNQTKPAATRSNPSERQVMTSQQT